MMRRLLQAVRFYKSERSMPVIDIEPYLNGQLSRINLQQIRSIFHTYGCAVIKDPRIDEAKNLSFLNMLEQYFIKRQLQLDRGQYVDVYKELDYEIGLSPPYINKVDYEPQILSKYTTENASLTPFPSMPLSKLRYFWNVGEVGRNDPQNRPPQDFPQFSKVMDSWGNCCYDTVNSVSQLLALSLNLPQNTFTQLLQGGLHKLAPMGNDLRRTKKGEPFTGIHDDFTLFTIHGKAKFPGLYIWLSTGEKMKVKIPNGCMLIQAGSELQYLTGGYIQSGYHQAINTQQVQQLSRKVIESGQQAWRITSTLFHHVRSDCLMQPLGQFRTEQSLKKYPPIKHVDFFNSYLKKRIVQ